MMSLQIRPIPSPTRSSRPGMARLAPRLGDRRFHIHRPDAAFTGVVPVQYSVSDGTNSTTGDVSIVVEPLVTQPVTVTELDHQKSVSLTILNLDQTPCKTSTRAQLYLFQPRRHRWRGLGPRDRLCQRGGRRIHLHPAERGNSPSGAYRLYGQRRHKHRQWHRDAPACGDRCRLR